MSTSSETQTLPADLRQVTDPEQVRTLQQAVQVFFSRPGPRLIAKTAGACWGVRLALGPLGPGDLAVMAGVGAWWPLQEWLMHKHLLHLPPREHGNDPEFAVVHRAHHVQPRDIDLTLLPMTVLRQAVPANVGLWLLLLGPSRRAVTAMATYSSMALIYEWTHFLVHTGYKPRSAFFKRVRKNHRLHHYRNEHNWYAFTLPLVDQLLGTDPAPNDVSFSATARDLFGLRAQQDAAE